jgi:hypothetical protein
MESLDDETALAPQVLQHNMHQLNSAGALKDHLMDVLIHDNPSSDWIDEVDSQGSEHTEVQCIQSVIALRLPGTVETHIHHGSFLDCVFGTHDDASQRWSALMETTQHSCWINNFRMSAREFESLFELL